MLVPKLVLLDPAILLPGHVALAAAENARVEASYISFEELIDRRYDESQLHSAPRGLVVEDLAPHVESGDDGRIRYRYCQSAVVAAYGELASPSPRFDDVRVPTLLVLGERSYLLYDHLLDAHRAALGELLEVAVVPGGHTVLWDALEETAQAIADFLER
jgi:lipase